MVSHHNLQSSILADMDVAGSRIEAGHVRDEVAERTQKRFQVRHSACLKNF